MAVGPDGARVVAGRYRLVARLGAGAMGTVWRAFDQVLETEAALKEIEFAGGVPDYERAERVERALREARHAAKLRGHPHVVTILDVVLEDGLPWIVMELVPSRSLFEVVRDDGPMPVPEVARIGIAMIDALLAARAQGIVHRDVKPSNVLIGTDGRVVLTDFGIATGDGDPTLTVTGVLGTPLYMAPERLNNAPATFEADMFSLGGTLYFAVEGRPPFERESFGAMLASVLLHPPTPMRLAGPLADVLTGLLEKEPERRLPAGAARSMLDTLIRSGLAAGGGGGGGGGGGSPAGSATATGTAVLGNRGGRPVVRADGLGWQARAGDAGGQGGVGSWRVPGTLEGEPEFGSGQFRPTGPAGEVPRVDPEAPTTLAGLPPVHPGGPAASETDWHDGNDEAAGHDDAAGHGGADGPVGAPPPPVGVSVVEQDGALLITWEPSPGAETYRVIRVVPDHSSDGGRRERSLGNTTATELFDAGVPKGVQVWHEVVAIGPSAGGGARSAPARSAARVVLPPVTALRADMTDDAVALSWRPVPGRDEVIIERTHDETSSMRGAMRRYRGFGGAFVDSDVQAGAVYRYRVWVAAGEESDGLRPSACAEVTARVIARPRAVVDLEARETLGGTVLRWTTVPGSVVRVYATQAPEQAGLAGTGPFGPVDREVGLGSLEGRARLVGESRRGRLVDRDGTGTGTGTVVYTPVSIAENRAVIGAAVTHTAP
ncbi:serine/threonine protein kinase [Parafrankia soli]|uniref:non-specific serine/threonine protein kinase n=1 Tax=Parafrankia soli TaxID=2599596 RepID=A0A1S1PNK3_9ACTN|nr:serine/threonine-protein kinase [Parafrankia soli]OHV22867.1 serine/threonine protein kinase [Parafrankia soli]